MAFRIIRVWVMWLVAMAIFAGVMWAVLGFSLPGGSSTTLEDLSDFAADIGIGAMLKILGVLLLPPIVLTLFEMAKTRGH